MRSSRNDFLITIRSAFLKKETQQKFSLFSLLIASIIILILGNLNYKIIDYLKIGINEVVYRVSNLASAPEKILKNSLFSINDHISHYENYDNVKKELKKLKSKDVSREIILFENKKLKKIIDDYVITDNEIFAKVLIDKKSPFLRSVVLSKGSKDNIKMGMAVLDETYLIGKIIEVNYTSSRVLLLSDLNSKIPVSIEPGDIQAVVSGTGKDSGSIQYLKEEYIIKNEQDGVVYTSGTGNLFKSGIPIGKIKYKDLISEKEKEVQFYSDFSQLKYVKILSFNEENIVLNSSKQEEINNIDNKITEIKGQEERIKILLYDKKISEEVRIRLENENLVLKNTLINLNNRLQKNIELANQKDLLLKRQKVDEEELIFLKLNLVYGIKCKKNFLNNLYKVSTPEYRKCVLNKGKKN